MNVPSARSTPANRLRFIGSGVLVLGLTAAYVFYRVRSQSLAPTLDDLLPGYSERRARQTGILMGGFVVSLLQGADKLKEPDAQAVDHRRRVGARGAVLFSGRMADGSARRVTSKRGGLGRSVGFEFPTEPFRQIGRLRAGSAQCERLRGGGPASRSASLSSDRKNDAPLRP